MSRIQHKVVFICSQVYCYKYTVNQVPFHVVPHLPFATMTICNDIEIKTYQMYPTTEPQVD